jgi:two-component system, response regulator PdtaR
MPGKILVVEDQFLVGLDLVQMIEELGFETLGPVTNVSDALAVLDQVSVSLAVLDLNLGSELSTPVAVSCIKRGISFLVASACDNLEVGGPAFEGVENIGKPYQPRIIFAALQRISTLQSPRLDHE